MKNIALYIRVSSQEQAQHGLSVETQEKALREYAQENGYNIVGVYTDAGISAHVNYKKRPALMRMISDCQIGKIDLVCFTKLDRFTRNVSNYYSIIELMNNIPWRAIWEDYETETSSGIFKVNIMLSIAQAESDRTSERIKNVFDYKRAKGDYVGQAPFGYMRKDKKLVKNPEEAPLVEEMIETYIRTHSSARTIQRMHELGHPVSRGNFAKLMSCETYRGNAYGFKCEPYIDEEKALIIDEIRKSNFRKPMGMEKTYLFPRLCVCGRCGKKMRALAKEGRFKSYLCDGVSKDNPHIGNVYSWSEKKIESYLLKELDGIIADYNIEADTIPIDTNYEENIKKKKQLEAKLERIGIRFEEGDISVEEYKKKKKSISSEIASLDFSTTIKKIELPSSWKEIYLELDDQHKQSFWLSIIKEIHLSKSEAPKIIFR